MRASSAAIAATRTRRYLRRIGVEDPGPPSVPALVALHRAHVERVPYEVLDVHLGRPSTVDPVESAERVLAGRGGYCVQLNGAFSTLLTALGYEVRWHRAGVHASRKLLPRSAQAPAPHLALTVVLDGTTWLVDVGLGDGLHEPVPLMEATHVQGPFRFRLRPSEVDAGGWRFDHDPRGAIAGMDVAPDAAGQADFAHWHHYLCTSQESRLVRALSVMRRDASGIDSLTGCVLRRVDAAGRTERELATPADWFGALGDVFGLTLAEVRDAERSELWAGVHAAHERWLTARAARAA
jgi:N-hydroxyarylamine O-acetyltransferase